MKTIDDFINEELLSRRMEKELALDESIERVYDANPKLREIDGDLVEARFKRITGIRGSSEDESLYRTELNLKEARLKYIKEHGINPDFEKEQVICAKCSDTGYVRGKNGMLVCSCMKEALSECYAYSGMESYTTFTMKGYKADYFGKGEARQNVLKKVAATMSDKYPMKPVMVYTGGAHSGKTYMAICLAKSNISLGRSSRYIKCNEIACMDAEDIDVLKKCKFLVIDDFSGASTKNIKIAEILSAVLEVREATRGVTLVVTGDTRQNIIDESDYRIASKLINAEFVCG